MTGDLRIERDGERSVEGAADGLLANLPPARRMILATLKKRGEATADELAAEAGTTVSAVRQHLRPLTEVGLVAFREERPGPGRPRRWYRLGTAAEAMFPRRYGELTRQLLGFIGEADAALVSQAFDRRREARVARALPRLTGKGWEARVRELTAILDEDGYLADCEPIGDGAWRIVEHNCAILDVARVYGEACSSELAFLREVMPDATVERVSHMVAGHHQCGYEVRPRS